MAIVPSKPTLMAGSLSPFGWSNGVLEKVRVPGVVAASAELDGASTKTVISNIENILRQSGRGTRPLLYVVVNMGIPL
jgi:hypothetical protein